MREVDAARLVDRLEREGPGPDLEPAEAEALREARRGLGLALDAGEVPEPGELFWSRFEAEVTRALPTRRRSLRGPAWLAAAAALVALSVSVPRAPEPPSAVGEWQALPEDDSSWEVVAALEGELEALEPEAACPMEECLLDLDESESRSLLALLREELEGRES